MDWAIAKDKYVGKPLKSAGKFSCQGGQNYKCTNVCHNGCMFVHEEGRLQMPCNA